VIVAETTALAGATTESLRNIELVESMGLAQQEVGRLNRTTPNRASSRQTRASSSSGSMAPVPVVAAVPITAKGADREHGWRILLRAARRSAPDR
jgi:hypothetical protein